ncbi:RICIN domain-containing protein [Streptomyces sp. NBC_00322]|uniref:RICIN domain-containing protein n=1 Tax=Streptomyces sp. NBC_00322 TaxID=2975712 RepID=UPI002E2889B7|nr:ricin-type beta-trefoil lectin domain protein [Streptomyces sp. NBC_00322]
MGSKREATLAWKRADELTEALAAELKQLQKEARGARRGAASVRAIGAALYQGRQVISDTLNGRLPGIHDEQKVVDIAGHCHTVLGTSTDEGYWRGRVQAAKRAFDWANAGNPLPEGEDAPPSVPGTAVVPIARGALAATQHDLDDVPERFRDWVIGFDEAEIVEDSGWLQSETPHAPPRPAGDGTGWQGTAAVPPHARRFARASKSDRRERAGHLATAADRIVAVCLGAVIIVGGSLFVASRPGEGGSDKASPEQGQNLLPPSPRSSPSLLPSNKPSSTASPAKRPLPPTPSPNRSAGGSSAPNREQATAKQPQPAPAAWAFGPDTWVVSAQSGKCADVGLSGEGSNLYQWSCAKGAANQLWNVREVRRSIYQFQNAHSGQCLTMRGGSAQLDAVQEPCSATSTQQQWNFMVNAAQNGWTYGYLRNERWGKCLDVSQESMDDGADIGPWDCVEHKTNQMFRVTPDSL